jgi:hypothetical protein
LVDVAGEIGAKPCRRRDGGGVLEAHHHIADRSIADVEYRSADGDDRLAGGGDHLGGDPVDAHLQERHCPRLARGGVRNSEWCGDEGQQRQGGEQTRQHRGGPHCPCPQPFVRRDGCSSGRRLRVCECVWACRRGEVRGSGGSEAGPSACSLSISSPATSASRRSSA